MKAPRIMLGFLAIAMVLATLDRSNPVAGPVASATNSATFSGLSANGTSGTLTTTELTLGFDVDRTNAAETLFRGYR